MSYVPEQCKLCAYWDWDRNTCMTSINCLNRVLHKEEPTRFTDIRDTFQALLKKEVSHA